MGSAEAEWKCFKLIDRKMSVCSTQRFNVFSSDVDIFAYGCLFPSYTRRWDFAEKVILHTHRQKNPTIVVSVSSVIWVLCNRGREGGCGSQINFPSQTHLKRIIFGIILLYGNDFFPGLATRAPSDTLYEGVLDCLLAWAANANEYWGHFIGINLNGTRETRPKYASIRKICRQTTRYKNHVLSPESIAKYMACVQLRIEEIIKYMSLEIDNTAFNVPTKLEEEAVLALSKILIINKY
jgi:hypothetical protein